MATATAPDPDRRKSIADLIARQLSYPSPFVKPDEAYELRESFELFLANSQDLIRASREGTSLAKCCKSSGVWYHAVAAGGKAAAIALTRPNDGEVFAGLQFGDLSERIENAVTLADAKFSDDFSATLVCLTETRIYFFLLVRVTAEEVLVISSTFPELGLRPGTIVAARELSDYLTRLPKTIGVDLGE